MLRINELKQIDLGIQGENLAQEITINISDWLVDNPNGSVTIWHKRNGDSVPTATGATMDRETGTVSWSPTSTDTYVEGEGLAEVRLSENGVVKKTRAIKTYVAPAVTLNGTPTGSSWQDYINVVDGLREAAEDAKDDAEDAQEAAEDAQEAAEAAQTAAETAQGAAEDAQDAAEDAQEAAEAAQAAAEDAKDDAVSAKNAAVSAKDDAVSAKNAAVSAKDDAVSAKTAAVSAKGSAETAAGNAEAWAVGQRDGVDVDSSDPAYHNNSKYYAEHTTEIAQTKADKTDTVLETTLSRGRKAGTTVGIRSFAFGYEVESSSGNSFAAGGNTKASGSDAVALGNHTTASGSTSFATGNYTTAAGSCSTAIGSSTKANGSTCFVFGQMNIEEEEPAAWVAGTSYNVGDLVKKGSMYYRCVTANDDETWTYEHWRITYCWKYAEIVGNGSIKENMVPSNARTLDWLGNEWIEGNMTAAGGSLTLGTGNDAVTITAAQLASLLEMLN